MFKQILEKINENRRLLSKLNLVMDFGHSINASDSRIKYLKSLFHPGYGQNVS